MLNGFGQGMVTNLCFLSVTEEKKGRGVKADQEKVGRTIIRQYKAPSLQVSPEH